MRKITFYLSILALLVLAIVPVTAQNDLASIRLAHFSPDAAAVDVYVNGDVAVENLQFTEVTPFLELAAGSYDLAIAPAGTSIDDAVITSSGLTLEANTTITVATVGSLENGTLAVTVIEEDYSPIDGNNARITIVHAVENESALDIYGSSILLVQSLRYPEGSGDGAFTRDVPAGRYNFEANVAGGDATVRVANGVELATGEYYLIVAIGPQANSGDLLIVSPEGFSVADDGEESTVVETEDSEEETTVETEDSEEEVVTETEDSEVVMPSEGTAMLRVAHFSPDTSAVDVYIDGGLVVAGLEFPEVTAFFGLAAGTYEVAVAPAGTSIDDVVVGPISITIEDDNNTTVATVGSSERDTLTATVFTEDYSALDAGTIRVTLVHTVEGEGALDIYGSGILLIQALRYPDLAAARDGAFTRDLPAGRYNFEANISEGNTTVRVANGIELEGSNYYMVVALGPQSNEGELLVVTPDGYENPDD